MHFKILACACYLLIILEVTLWTLCVHTFLIVRILCDSINRLVGPSLHPSDFVASFPCPYAIVIFVTNPAHPLINGLATCPILFLPTDWLITGIYLNPRRNTRKTNDASKREYFRWEHKTNVLSMEFFVSGWISCPVLSFFWLNSQISSIFFFPLLFQTCV